MVNRLEMVSGQWTLGLLIFWDCQFAWAKGLYRLNDCISSPGCDHNNSWFTLDCLCDQYFFVLSPFPLTLSAWPISNLHQLKSLEIIDKSSALNAIITYLTTKVLLILWLSPSLIVAESQRVSFYAAATNSVEKTTLLSKFFIKHFPPF